MKTSYVYFPEKEKAVFAQRELDTNLVRDEVLVKTDYDLISAGTELANYHDLPNVGVFGKVENHTFPRYPGYTASGHVVAIGPDVKQYKVGDRVIVSGSGHCACFKKTEGSLFPVADGVSQKEAAFAYLCTFPFLGVRKLKIQLGESCMVAGLGVLGLVAIQLAKASGAYPVLACDFSQERRDLALKLGADYVFDPRDPDFIQKVRDAATPELAGQNLRNPYLQGPEAVVEVTGYLSGLQQALEYVHFMGRISILGCTRISDQPINVYRYIHGKGVEIIGAHTMTRPGQESRPGQWTVLDDYRTFMKLVKAGALKLDPVINRIVSPKDCDEVYRTIGFEKNPPFGILFDWTNIE